MAGRRFDREPIRPNDRAHEHSPDIRPPHGDFQRRPPPPYGQGRRSSPARPANSPPTYDRQPKSDTIELKIKGASAAKERDVIAFSADRRDGPEIRRQRSTSPSLRPQRPYRDRGQEGYRSRSPRERDAYRPRQWPIESDRSEDRGYVRPLDRYRERSPQRGRETRQERSPDRPRERSPANYGTSYHRRERERTYERSEDRDWRRAIEASPERRPRSPRERSRRTREESRHRELGHSRERRRDESPFFGGPPSRDVILEGLPASWTEDDITKELTQYHGVETVDAVRVIRDKITRQSRRFGFVTFPSIQAAKDFLTSTFPSLSVKSPPKVDADADASRIRVAFSIARDDRETQQKAKSGDWMCQSCSFMNFKGRTSCRQCHAQYDPSLTSDLAATSHLNIGDSDVSPDSTPSQFLIIRNLEPSVNEDLFSRGVLKLLKPTNPEQTSGPNPGKKGKNKVRSTTGDANLGAREGSLRRILLVRDRATNDSWRYGFAEFSTIEEAQAALIRYNSFERFTIASKPVTVDYIHAGVFVPVLNGQSNFNFSPLGNPSAQLTYWDENAYCNELIVSEDADDHTNKDTIMDVVDPSINAAAADKESKARKRKGDATESAAKQKKSTPAHLQYWSDRHAELHGKKRNANDNEGAPEDEDDKAETVAEETPKISIPTFVDLNSACCWLCMRQFEDRAEAARHERSEEGHLHNLKDETAVAKAKEMIAKRSVPRREIANTWIDLFGQFCYLCYCGFNTIAETSRHEYLSTMHRANLSKKDAVQNGLGILQVNKVVLRVVSDAYVDTAGKCCYLCSTEFEHALQTRRHRWASTKHQANLKDERALKHADALVGGLQIVKPEAFPENFIDKRSKSCLLCWKQFAADDALARHENSTLHRKNLADEDTVYSANVRIGRATGLDADPTHGTSAEYRDRAAERRKAFGTSEKISLAFGKKKSNKADAQSEPKETPAAPPPPSKGAALLGKMGWQAGEGLGAQSTGRTAPIATDMYAQGVGLGAQGGKLGDAVEEAGRQTGGDYKEFVSRTRDKAKERYQNME